MSASSILSPFVFHELALRLSQIDDGTHHCPGDWHWHSLEECIQNGDANNRCDVQGA
jgi:hypothetical protein